MKIILNVIADVYLFFLLFALDNIALAAGKSFDYETLNYYQLALYVTDSMAASGPYYLGIHVLDDPEVCKFPQTLYRFDTFESGVSNVP